tara:strand:- start:1653 stop:1982 length:330 start_codon:yes stop_codon:yes gene_type:complete
MSLDHEAIYKAYAGTVVTIDDGAGAFDKDGKFVSLDQNKIDAARTELNTEAAKVKYKTDRTTNGSITYPAIGDQLDLLWHAIDADSDLKSKFSAFYNSIKEVKDANPKP